VNVDTRKILIAAVALIAAAAPLPAQAAPIAATTDATGEALILIPLTLTKIDNIDFGTVVSSSASGSVTIAPDGSGRTTSGGVTPVASDAGARGLFAGAGSFGEQVGMFLSPPATISDGFGNSMPISLNLESNIVTIDATRAFFVGVGGTVNVGANQPDGIYSGTFTVLAQYN
jgi:hypothetical protein